MNRSLSSVLVVAVSLIVALSGTWFYLRIKSEGKPQKTPFDHAFIKMAHANGRKLLLVRVSQVADLTTVADAAALAKKAAAGKTVGLWLDVRLAGENQLVVTPEETLPSGPFKGKPIEIASRSECASAGLVEITEFYDALRTYPAVLNLISRRPGLSNKILELWGPDKPLSLDSIVMQSESDGTLKELREAQPRGLYGSSQSTLIQMEILANLNLQGLMDLKADVIVTAIEEFHDGQPRARVRASTLEQAHHRGLKRYAGPARTAEAANELLSSGYDGIILNNADVLANLLP